MKKNKTVAFILGALMLALSACKKDSLPSAFWTEGKKFEFQNSVYYREDGNEIEFISLGNWDSNNPNIAHAKIYTGRKGGQNSFSNTASQYNYVIISDSVELDGVYSDNAMLFPYKGIEIFVVGSGGFYYAGNYANDVRKISELRIGNKSYKPYSFNRGIASYNTAGIEINIMIQRGKVCSFNTCVNGVSQQIIWEISTDNKMNITGSFGSIIGYISQPTQFSTPIITTSDGRVYLLQMFTTATRNDAVCACTERFKLYIISNYKSSNPINQLFLGDC